MVLDFRELQSLNKNAKLDRQILRLSHSKITDDNLSFWLLKINKGQEYTLGTSVGKENSPF